MFADDTKVFKAIQSPNDAVKLQEDITNLGIWSSESGLQFNETKCKAQPITRKTNPIPTTYFMNDAPLASIKHEHDLGVWISSDLNKQIKCLATSDGTHKQLTVLKQEEPFQFEDIVITSSYGKF